MKPMRVLEWDDDLAVLLPESLVAELNIKEGDDLNIAAADPQRIDTDKPPSDGD